MSVLRTAFELPMSFRRAALLTAALSLVAQFAMLAWSGAAHREAVLFGDEKEYWDLAAGPLFSQFRPPGYPLIVAASRHLQDSTAPLFFLQSALLAVAPVSVLLLAHRRSGGARWPFVVGAVLCGWSFNALMLSKRVLADAPFGVAAPWALVLMLSNPDRSPVRDWIAGVLAACALLLKPIFMLWFPLAAAIVALSSVSVSHRVRALVRLVLLPGAVWLCGTLAVRDRCDVARYSLSGLATTQRYFLPATLCIAEEGRWRDECIRARRDRTDSGALYRCPTTPHDVAESGLQVRRELLAHPAAAAEALMQAFWRNAPRPFHAHELRAISARPVPTLLGLLKPVSYVVWLLAAVGLVRLWLRDRALAVGLGLCLASFGLATSISFWEGGRILFPMEPLLFAAVGHGLSGVASPLTSGAG